MQPFSPRVSPSFEQRKRPPAELLPHCKRVIWFPELDNVAVVGFMLGVLLLQKNEEHVFIEISVIVQLNVLIGRCKSHLILGSPHFGISQMY